MTDLQNTFEYVGLTGHVLSPAEQTALAGSLAVLSREVGRPVVFWGKVFGYQGAYLLAQTVSTVQGNAVNLDSLGHETAFHSTDGGHNWHVLEPPTHRQTQFCDQLRGRFVGLPNHLYKVKQRMSDEDPQKAADAAEEKPVDDEADEGAEEEGEEADGEEKPARDEDKADDAEDKPPVKRKPKVVVIALAEAARLAHFVRNHNERCRAVPSGQLLLSDSARVTVNKTFAGLTPSDAMDLSSYCHLRKPSLADIPQSRSPHYNAAADFMEPLSVDVPDGVWTLQYDPSLSVVVGKNFLYPGTVFYHQANTRLFGQYYFGTGEQNVDLCFMMP